MQTKKDIITECVSRRIYRWQKTAELGSTKAELARLRRCIGRKPGEIPDVVGILYEDLPEEMLSRSGEPTWEEWAISIALSLYAYHQMGKGVGSETVNAKGYSVGKAMRQLVRSDDDLERVRRRFNVCTAASGIQECAYYLRGIVQLLSRANIPLDYPALARDLYQLQTPDSASRVKLRWGQDFYCYKKNKEEENDEK